MFNINNLNDCQKILGSVICGCVVFILVLNCVVIPLTFKEFIGKYDSKYVQNYPKIIKNNGYFNILLEEQNQSVANVSKYFLSENKVTSNAPNISLRIKPIPPNWIRNVS